MKTLVKGLLAISLACLLLLGLAGCDLGDQTSIHDFKLLKKNALSGMMLDLSGAECILLSSGGETMMIDAGSIDDGDKIVKYLRKEGIGKLSYLILTHQDPDHIGGAAWILEEIPADHVIIPADSSMNLDFTHPSMMELSQETTFSLGNASVTCYIAGTSAKESGASSDVASILTRVTYGEKSMLFTADTRDEQLDELMDMNLSCDLLQLPNHGKIDGKDAGILLDQLSPSDVIVNGGEVVPQKQLEERRIECHTTEGGAIFFETNGQSVTVTQENGMTG